MYIFLQKMANNENYEPMQVDAAEENDNDGDIGVAFHQQAEGGLGAANGFHGVGGFIAPGVIPPGNYPRGDVYGEDTRVCYNIENPSIDLEAYALGYTGLAAIYRLRFIAHHCPMLKVYIFVLLLKWLHHIIFASDVFHNSHLIQKSMYTRAGRRKVWKSGCASSN